MEAQEFLISSAFGISVFLHGCHHACHAFIEFGLEGEVAVALFRLSWLGSLVMGCANFLGM